MPEKILTFTAEEVARMLESVEMRLLTASAKPVFSLETAWGVNLQEAKNILGEDFLGPEAVEKAFGLELAPKDIPPIRFSLVELERAEELGHMLVLRVNRAPDGEWLTIEKIDSLLQEKFTIEGKGEIFYRGSECQLFVKEDTPQPGWALVSKKAVQNTHGLNYLHQTQVLATYIRDELFRGMLLPNSYGDAIKEFDGQKAGIDVLLDVDSELYGPTDAARKLAGLKLSRLFRHTPMDALYDAVVYLQNTGQRMFEYDYTWTSLLSSDGYLFIFGEFDDSGAFIDEAAVEKYDELVGVYSSRRSL